MSCTALDGRQLPAALRRIARPDVFHHACKLGLEGIMSKRKDSRYRSGRSPDCVKSKNPNAPAVKRLDEEEWGGWSRKAETFEPVTIT